MSIVHTPQPRKLPKLDAESGFFWTSGADGKLRILRCGDCGRYQHPPLPFCPVCHSEAMAPSTVSGDGHIVTYTINHQAWRPGLEAPYVFAVVELIEQQELYVFTNILAPLESVRAGMPVSVCFEQREDVYLPLFQPSGAQHG